MFTIKIAGEDELSAKLSIASKAVGELTEEFLEVGKQMTDFFSTEPFLSQGGVYGERWAALADSTKKQKERKYPGRGVLVASGDMQNSFKYSATPVSVTIMNSSKLFAFHQLGTTKMPQRVMMLLDDTRQKKVISIVEEMLTPKLEVVFNG